MQSGTQTNRAEFRTYAGDVTPQEAWDMVSKDPSALLVDVRTPAEWQATGYPDLAALGREAVRLSWKLHPEYRVNPDFVASLQTQAAGFDVPILFLCRSGGRSQEAAQALTAAGYRRCYNIAGGFEGGLPQDYLASRPAGWLVSNLPVKREVAA